MGEGAEERCKVVFLREQALLQSYFSSQVTADQSVAMSVARLVWRDCREQLATSRCVLQSQVVDTDDARCHALLALRSLL